jgi:hypothetical protein
MDHATRKAHLGTPRGPRSKELTNASRIHATQRNAVRRNFSRI